MNRVSTYIRQSLQDYYSPQELKTLTMMLCCDVLGFEAIDVYLGKDINLSESKQCELENILARMQKNEPIQYVLGTAMFCGMPFDVAPGVLIPRPETEELVDLVVRENPGSSHILDMGTGSGCIAISLSKKLPEAKVTAWDISDEALVIARRNNGKLQATVMFEQQDILSYHSDSEAVFDVIVSNPPYITDSERQEMDANVLEWEPAQALFVPDDDPLRFYRRIALLGRKLLRTEGKLYFEINRAYGNETVLMLEETGYKGIRVLKDQFGNTRIVTAYR
ncbi:peptide chain release factor N(5)-glutamine methyltransferase [Bacteroides neonati]|uniref:peptide chain release factor N(5)-glutamine methyltransferase n=1 Tax=Bacteroides neonati TaxID=1347393 RepID=UPI0004BB7F6C|nr:peptide chain release factor N(5)-glutamine methyltransferase [Bacteroides neonati]